MLHANRACGSTWRKPRGDWWKKNKWRGHPTGISGSSNSPSPYRLITVPKSGTSMVALRRMCALLHCHVSKDNSPRAATSSRAAKVGCSRSGAASSRTDSRSLCMGPRPLANSAVVHEQRFRPQTRWGEGLSLQLLLVTG